MGSCCITGHYASASQPLLSDDQKYDSALSASESATDSKWSKSLKRDAERDRKVKKLLLLGPGNSGKSTFFKQLLRIHGDGLSDLKRQYFAQSDVRRAILDNVVDQMRALVAQCRQLHSEADADAKENYALSESEEAAAAALESIPSDIHCAASQMDSAVSAHIGTLWSSASIKRAFAERRSLAVVDSAAYFLDALERLSARDYEPTERDVLLVRTPTTGIISASFSMSNHEFQVFDAGGQKCERAKWIHCFDNVTAVLFVAALSCFDQTLFEAANVNAMAEALQLWSEILNSRWFRPTAMILFLNKCDLFREKLTTGKKELKECFKDYAGDNSYADAVEFVKRRFLERNENPKGREVYCHVTCATDKNNVEKVFHDVQNIVVNSALHRGGLL